MKQLYDTTKKLSGNRREPERPMKSKEGKVITNIEEQRNRWVENNGREQTRCQRTKKSARSDGSGYYTH
ncbi:unnamed protein product [Schistosoma margrebowiei]|uniref:Uncharacterized protein n=1 Tax=Schistosoma margrebowiei TaxID=48269 RepID=A0A183N9L4_9TREM|nr:unnamed protein product [Schistosoma margrebowiei]